MTYARGDEWFNLEIMDFADGDDVTIDFEYELLTLTTQVIEMAGVDVTLYYNSDDLGLYASWLIGQVHYSVNGMLSEDDLTHIIQSLQLYQT